MNRTALYSVLASSGCSVSAFEDHPKFFGNWLAHFKRGSTLYEVVSDNREGWLTLWRKTDEGKGERLYEIHSHTFDEAKELSVIKAWLHELQP